MSLNTICLCGSTRFVENFERANIELTKCGLSVISIAMALPKNEQGNEEDEGLKDFLDIVHFNKILRSDAVFVVGDGYIGRSTAREILWAVMQSKPVVTEWGEWKTWPDVAFALALGRQDPVIYGLACKILSLKQHWALHL